MKVIPGGLPSQEEEDVKSKEQPVISLSAKKLTNDMKVKSEMAENCHEARVSDDTVSCEKDCYDSCSDDDSNSNVNAQEKGKKSKASKHNDLGKAENSGIDELTTKVFKMKVKENNEDPVEDLSDKLSAITVKEEVKDSCQSKEEVKDGRQSPQLLSRGPEGGKPTAFNHQMYGTSDWSSVQADVRMKSMSGKRGFDDETNPFKYSRNLPTAENGDYVDMSYIDPITQYSLSQQHLSQQTNFQQQFLPQNVVSPEILQRPKARACRSNFNNLNQPQTSNFVNVTAKNVLSGGSVTVIPSEPVSQATPMYTTPEMDPDWDPDSLLELLAEEDDLRNVPAVTEIQKPKRNHSGDDSGYDSEVSRMSVTSPYSPESVTCMSPESLPSPKSMGQAAYMPQMAFSPASNIGSPMTNIASPHSVDSGMASAGSPSSYRDMGSPGSSISAMSPGNVMSVEPPTPQMGMPMVDASLSADTIISELNKPIPTSSVDPKVSLGQYIDDNLSQLQDVYAVIANELKDSQHKRTESALKGNKEAKQTNIPKPVGSQVSQNSKMKPVGTALPGTCTAVPMTNSMTPVILKPVTGTPITPVNSKSNNIKPVAQGVPVGPMGKVMGQPIVPVSAGQNIVWVPVNATPGVINAQPIFIMRQAPTANQKKGTSTRPRPILPKMPNVMPGTGKSSASSTVNNSKSSTAAPTAKPQTTQSTKPTMAHHVSAQPANVAQSTMIPTASSGPKQQGVNGPLPMMPGQYQQQGQFQVPQQQMFQQQLSQQQYQQHAMPQGPVPQQGMMGQQGSIPNHKLNLARRYVAEMKKENLHYQDEEGDTYLHIAICRTDPYMVKAILERLVRENLIKELIDKPNRKRQTPLYVAVADNQPQMVKELVQCGADPNFLAECKWNNGLRKEVKAAIHCAAQGGHLFSATLRELLHAKDIALNIANSEGLTALHCAIQEHGKVRGGQHLINAMPSVEMLIRAGADPNVQDKKSGKTPLMYAIETKDYNLVYSMVQLIGRDRLRNMLKTQTFDGSNCSKICSGLRMESDPEGFRKINSLILSASNGSDLRLYEQPPMMSA